MTSSGEVAKLKLPLCASYVGKLLCPMYPCKWPYLELAFGLSVLEQHSELFGRQPALYVDKWLILS